MSQPSPLCRDMSLWWQWAVVSQQESYVTIGFPGRQGGLGRDRDFSVAIRDGIGSDLDRIFQNPYPILNKNNISISISIYYG